MLCVAVAHGAIVPTRAATPGLATSVSTAPFWRSTLAPPTSSLQRLAHRTRGPPVAA
jgi:hypothetical protein